MKTPAEQDGQDLHGRYNSGIDWYNITHEERSAWIAVASKMPLPPAQEYGIHDFFQKVLQPVAGIDREAASHYLRSMVHQEVHTPFVFWADLPEETKNMYRGMQYTEADLAILRSLTDESMGDNPEVPEFIKGQIVRMRSGGPRMTVLDCPDPMTVFCSWFVRENLESATFDRTLIESIHES